MENTEPANTDLLLFEQAPQRASQGKRFANYIIDLFVFYAIIIIVVIVLIFVNPKFSEWVESDDVSSSIVERILALVAFGTYMGFVEMIFKGKSIGKFITRTRAVNPDGSRISAGKAFSRGFSRAVPFEPFSALGSPCNPWHDKWTNTLVVDEKLTNQDQL